MGETNHLEAGEILLGPGGLVSAVHPKLSDLTSMAKAEFVLGV